MPKENCIKMLKLRVHMDTHAKKIAKKAVEISIQPKRAEEYIMDSLEY